MRKALGVLFNVIAFGSADAAILYEHQFAPGTPQACTSCIPQPPQLNRVWDAFDLSAPAEITAIEALLGFDVSYLTSGTTPINYSIWDQTRSTKLFTQDFLPNQLTINLVQAPSYDVVAQLTPLPLNAGTYYLSIFNGNQIEALGWNVSPVTLSGRSVQTIGPTFAPLPSENSASGRDMAFRVIGEATAVPEPSTALLVLIGAFALGALGYRTPAQSDITGHGRLPRCIPGGERPNLRALAKLLRDRR
ncbi:MAG: PEP-CTERM sorting domain-containing protein [Burkholderiaceae bacterium]